MANINNTPEDDQTPSYPDLNLETSDDYAKLAGKGSKVFGMDVPKELVGGFKSEITLAPGSPSVDWQIEDNKRMGLGTDSGIYEKKGTGTP